MCRPTPRFASARLAAAAVFAMDTFVCSNPELDAALALSSKESGIKRAELNKIAERLNIKKGDLTALMAAMPSRSTRTDSSEAAKARKSLISLCAPVIKKMREQQQVAASLAGAPPPVSAKRKASDVPETDLSDTLISASRIAPGAIILTGTGEPGKVSQVDKGGNATVIGEEFSLTSKAERLAHAHNDEFIKKTLKVDHTLAIPNMPVKPGNLIAYQAAEDTNVSARLVLCIGSERGPFPTSFGSLPVSTKDEERIAHADFDGTSISDLRISDAAKTLRTHAALIQGVDSGTLLFSPRARALITPLDTDAANPFGTYGGFTHHTGPGLDHDDLDANDKHARELLSSAAPSSIHTGASARGPPAHTDNPDSFGRYCMQNLRATAGHIKDHKALKAAAKAATMADGVRVVAFMHDTYSDSQYKNIVSSTVIESMLLLDASVNLPWINSSATTYDAARHDAEMAFAAFE